MGQKSDFSHKSSIWNCDAIEAKKKGTRKRKNKKKKREGERKKKTQSKLKARTKNTMRCSPPPPWTAQTNFSVEKSFVEGRRKEAWEGPWRFR